MTLEQVQSLVLRVTAEVPYWAMSFIVARDRKQPVDGRVFIQCLYYAPCTISGEHKAWKGRKWYLSDHMTEDEVVKTCYVAFKMTVEHEVMEGFKLDGQRVFNPHTPYNVLMQAAQTEQYRQPM